jgi:hypothetical protein
MSRTRFLALTVAVLAALTPLLVSPGPSAAAPNPNKPVVLTVDETFPAPNLTNHCGFAVMAHVTGTFTIKLLRSGVELDRIRYQHTFSGPGGSVTYNHIENVIFTTSLSTDGTHIDTITSTGTLLYNVVIPGRGSLANNSGREIVQITWHEDPESGEFVEDDFQVLFDTGPNNELTDMEFAVVCAQLA